MMKILYKHGYSKPEEMDIEHISASASFLELITKNGVIHPAERITFDNGKITAHLSENA
jgi:hypothetical protein